MGLITLTSDFGTRDAYVAAMKGVILSICPAATLVDVTHEIPPQDVREAAFLLQQVAEAFPEGTIHLAVVDPGVGTPRRAVAVQTDRCSFVLPDNGLLSYVLKGQEEYSAVELTNTAYQRQPVSVTFHGRDIFAPAAAHLCAGVPLSAFGPAVHDLLLFDIPRPLHGPGEVRGEIIHVDRFGNLITNIRSEHVAGADFEALEFGGNRISRLGHTYADANPGELIVLFGSSGYLEIALPQGSAAQYLKADRGMPVRIALRNLAH